MRPTHLVCAVSIVSVLVVSPSLSRAQGAPDTLSFQGYLTDSGGTPITDPSVSMTVKLYKGGVAIWEEAHPSVEVTDGVFNILLGGTTPLDTLAFNAPLEVGITVDGDPEISPRTPLAAAPYAKALPGLHTSYREATGYGSYNVVGGAPNNTVSLGVTGATISGGGGQYLGLGPVANTVTGLFGTVGGGDQNSAHVLATVGGGSGNTASGLNSTISGGVGNSASGDNSAVPGGVFNTAAGEYSFAAGRRAKALHTSTFVWADSTSPGGADFESTAPQQFLIRAAGGVGIGTNFPESQLTVNGMIESTSEGYKFPDGTVQTTAGGAGAFWSLGGNAGTTPGTNFIGTTDSAALELRVNNLPRMTIEPAIDVNVVATNVVLGSPNNSISGGVAGGTISGGGGSTEGAGDQNEVTGTWGTVGGGADNSASASSTVSGGRYNAASGPSSTVGGGIHNTASGDRSTVGGGGTNTASGARSSVLGGTDNAASGKNSAVAGGSLNVAAGGYSFASGRRAKANHNGSWVWADSSANADFVSTDVDQFLIRASGGVGIGTNAPGSPLTVDGMIESESQGFKFPDGTVQTTAAGDANSFWSLTGNSGVDPNTNFIGSLESPLQIKVDNRRVLSFEEVFTMTRFGLNVLAGFENNYIDDGVIGGTISGGGGSDGPVLASLNPDSVMGNWGTIGGGGRNYAAGYATVGGGRNNKARGSYSTVGGGSANVITGSYSAIPGGALNGVGASYSMAAGRRAKADHAGTFVWADDTDADFQSTAERQFLIRASGGVGIGTASPDNQLSVNGIADVDSLGIGTATPGTRLDILGGNFDLTNTEGDVRIGTASNRLKIGVATGGGGRGRAILRSVGLISEIRLGADDADIVLVNKTDGFAPALDNTYTLGSGSRRWTEVYSATGVINTSDRRLKKSIEDVDYGLEQVDRLRPVSFEWKDPSSSPGRHLGLIAQEVEQVVPEVVHHGATEEEALGLNYSELIPVLIKAIQEQQAIIASQQAELDDQSERIAILEKRITP